MRHCAFIKIQIMWHIRREIATEKNIQRWNFVWHNKANMRDMTFLLGSLSGRRESILMNLIISSNSINYTSIRERRRKCLKNVHSSDKNGSGFLVVIKCNLFCENSLHFFPLLPLLPRNYLCICVERESEKLAVRRYENFFLDTSEHEAFT